MYNRSQPTSKTAPAISHVGLRSQRSACADVKVSEPGWEGDEVGAGGAGNGEGTRRAAYSHAADLKESIQPQG